MTGERWRKQVMKEDELSTFNFLIEDENEDEDEGGFQNELPLIARCTVLQSFRQQYLFGRQIGEFKRSP